MEAINCGKIKNDNSVLYCYVVLVLVVKELLTNTKLTSLY